MSPELVDGLLVSSANCGRSLSDVDCWTALCTGMLVVEAVVSGSSCCLFLSGTCSGYVLLSVVDVGLLPSIRSDSDESVVVRD